MSEKCQPDDPNRCQGVTSHGQCEYLAVEASKYCEYHTKRSNQSSPDARKAERYLIDNQELRQSYLRQRDDSQYLDLKDEILLLQALLERRLNTIKTDADLMQSVSAATTLIQRLESMKISLMKIQQQMGLVLGKDEIRALAINVADILNDEIPIIDKKETIIDTIMERIFLSIDEAGKGEEHE